LDWLYRQSTGELSYQPPDSLGGGPPAPKGTGYSGNGVGYNNPAEQNTENVGPIPRGTWTIGTQEDITTNSGHELKAAMRLTPIDVTTDRSGFLIHGDNSKGDNSASQGCIILGPSIRDMIGKSSDKTLRVYK
jgi:hypothetical protein